MLNDDDRAAAAELAREMQFIEAAKWLRSVSSLGLRECAWWAERIAKENPGTPLAASLADRST